jgi:hypothetical protein
MYWMHRPWIFLERLNGSRKIDPTGFTGLTGYGSRPRCANEKAAMRKTTQKKD